MNTCKTCRHWQKPSDANKGYMALGLCDPTDPDSGEPMNRGFEVRVCQQPTQTRFESPVEANGFGLTDGSNYYAALCTAEDFGCIRHEAA